MSSFSLLTVFTRPISSRRATAVHLYNQWEPVRKIGSPAHASLWCRDDSDTV